MTTTTVTALTRREAWDAIYTTLICEGLVPIDVDLHPTLLHITIQMAHDETDDVDAARSALGIKPANDWSPRGKRNVWSAGTADAWFAHGSLTACYDDPSHVLPGWQVAVYCNVYFDDSVGLSLTHCNHISGLSFTHCNHISGCRKPLPPSDERGDLLCDDHPTMSEIRAGAQDVTR